MQKQTNLHYVNYVTYFCANSYSCYRIKFAFEKKVFKNSKAIYSIDSMGILAKLGALFLLLIIVIAFLYFFDEPTFCNTLANVMNLNISSKICGSQICTNNPIIMKEQHNFTTAEIKAIAQSSPIAINPANAVFFGTWKKYVTYAL